MTFGKEPADPQPEDSMYWPNGEDGKRWFGKEGKLYELDFVLLEERLPET